MDHLMYPLNTFVAQLHVPFLCDGEAEYDGYPFKPYPIRKRWSQAVDDLLWLQCADVNGLAVFWSFVELLWPRRPKSHPTRVRHLHRLHQIVHSTHPVHIGDPESQKFRCKCGRLKIVVSGGLAAERIG